MIGLLKVEYHDICDICIPVPRRRPLALLFNEALADKDREKVRLEELVKSKSWPKKNRGLLDEKRWSRFVSMQRHTEEASVCVLFCLDSIWNMLQTREEMATTQTRQEKMISRLVWMGAAMKLFQMVSGRIWQQETWYRCGAHGVYIYIYMVYIKINIYACQSILSCLVLFWLGAGYSKGWRTTSYHRCLLGRVGSPVNQEWPLWKARENPSAERLQRKIHWSTCWRSQARGEVLWLGASTKGACACSDLMVQWCLASYWGAFMWQLCRRIRGPFS